MEAITEYLNNREIAGVVWTIVILAFFLRKDSVRSSMGVAFKGLLKSTIILTILSMAAYVLLEIYALSNVGLWSASMLKDTIWWFIASAFVMVVNCVTKDDKIRTIGAVLLRSVGLVIVLEHVLNTYVLSLPGELILMPVLTLLTCTAVLCQTDDKFASVGKLVNGLLAVAGFFLLTQAVIRVFDQVDVFWSVQTLKDIAYAPLLTFLFIPFVYGYVLYSEYQLQFLRLPLWMRDDESQVKVIRRQIMFLCLLSLSKLDRLRVGFYSDLTEAKTDEETKNVIHEWCNGTRTNPVYDDAELETDED